MTTGPAAQPPGWHPDPAGGGGLRWWDGAAWTTHVATPDAVEHRRRVWPWAAGGVATLVAVLAMSLAILVPPAVHRRHAREDKVAQAAARATMAAAQSIYAGDGSFGFVTPDRLHGAAPDLAFTNGVSRDAATASVYATDQGFAVAVRSASGSCWGARTTHAASDGGAGARATGRLPRRVPCAGALATAALAEEPF